MLMRVAFLALVTTLAGAAADLGWRAQLIGGSVGSVRSRSHGNVQSVDPEAFVFVSDGGTLRVPYSRINLIEYGQDVGRRVILAWAISPIFLLAKSRKHFVTVGYIDDMGRQQALVLRVDKHAIRSALAALEARTGRTVKYQDEEARKYRQP